MFETVILAIVQSLAEFLPISSSAHLILIPRLLGWPDQGIGMDIGLHIGTLSAVVMYFWSDFLGLFKGLYQKGENQRLLINLIVGTLPILVVGACFSDIVEVTLRNPLFIAYTLMIFGVLLYIADRFGRQDKTIKTLTIRQAFVIGCAQCLSLMPGVSRSGITMTAGRFCGLRRVDTAKFAMILSVPAIAAAAVWHFGSLIFEKGNLAMMLTAQFYWGIVFAFIGGFITVWFLMRWVKTESFLIFTLYRLALGAYLLYIF